jgi:intracellular sulfur oxidation DsrE/DsrF family protein
MRDDQARQPRREFLERLGLVAVAASVPSVRILDVTRRRVAAPGWDMSWVERVAAARYKAVVDATKVQDDELETALDLMDTFHEVYPSDEMRVVVVLRHYAAAMGLDDAMWDRYAIGEERTVTDPATRAPAKRNLYLRAAPDAKEAWERNGKIEPLVARGVIFLVCNRATMSLASTLAKKANKPVEEVKADLRANLVPGATLMPNGIFALIRAQNAGCAFYRQA